MVAGRREIVGVKTPALTAPIERRLKPSCKLKLAPQKSEETFIASGLG
jgi:hypothetical protein